METHGQFIRRIHKERQQKLFEDFTAYKQAREKAKKKPKEPAIVSQVAPDDYAQYPNQLGAIGGDSGGDYI